MKIDTYEIDEIVTASHPIIMRGAVQYKGTENKSDDRRASRMTVRNTSVLDAFFPHFRNCKFERIF